MTNSSIRFGFDWRDYFARVSEMTSNGIPTGEAFSRAAVDEDEGIDPRECEFDCFYNDSHVPKFLEWLSGQVE